MRLRIWLFLCYYPGVLTVWIVQKVRRDPKPINPWRWPDEVRAIVKSFEDVSTHSLDP